ncbi:MAG TPA: acyl-CoA thioesterase II, partial [Mycobacterium sp.]
MSTLLDLLDVTGGPSDTWRGRGSGPAGKRAYGGQLVAQALAAAARTVEAP